MLLSLMRMFHAFRDYQRNVAELSQLTDRELADIGLTPSDLRDVSALALDRDPAVLLAERAHERRRNAFGPPPGRASDDWAPFPRGAVRTG